MRFGERFPINTEAFSCGGEGHEARGQTKRKRHGGHRPNGKTERKGQRGQRPNGQSERNTYTQTLENTRSTIKKYTERKRGDLSVKCVL